MGGGAGINQSGQVSSANALHKDMYDVKADKKGNGFDSRIQASEQRSEIIKKLNELEARMDAQESSIRDIERQMAYFKLSGKQYSSKINLKKKADNINSHNIPPHYKSRYINNYTQSEKLYKKARSLFLEENFKQAEVLFRRFIKKYPKNDLSDNSFYWLGECYYSMGNYKEAVKIFKELLKKYPRGDKVPDALLKIAYSYLALDDMNRAHYYLKQVVTQYPFSEAGDKAELKLKTFQ